MVFRRDVPLDGLGLSDNEGKPLKWRFPDGAVIPAHGYYLVLCTGKDRMDTVKNAPHTNFKISAEQETIILTDSQGHVVDRVMIDNLPLDCSWGRNDEGQLQLFQTPTPSLPNNQTGFSQMDVNLRAMNKTGVFISEVLASNDTVATYPDAPYTTGLRSTIPEARPWTCPAGASATAWTTAENGSSPGAR